MSYSDLQKELQLQIINQLGPRSMVVNKSFYNLRKQKYCEEFDPTETQILNYIDNADKYDIPYVKYALKYQHYGNLYYTYIVNVSYLDTTLIFQYEILDHNIMEVDKLYISDSLFFHLVQFGDHQYYDLDLFSLYQIALNYCDVNQAKLVIKNKLDKVLEFINNYDADNIIYGENYNTNPYDYEVQENQYVNLLLNYIYISTSAMILNLKKDWYSQSNLHRRKDPIFITSHVEEPNEEEMIEELQILCQLLYDYFNL